MTAPFLYTHRPKIFKSSNNVSKRVLTRYHDQYDNYIKTTRIGICITRHSHNIQSQINIRPTKITPRRSRQTRSARGAQEEEDDPGHRFLEAAPLRPVLSEAANRAYHAHQSAGCADQTGRHHPHLQSPDDSVLTCMCGLFGGARVSEVEDDSALMGERSRRFVCRSRGAAGGESRLRLIF